MRGLALRVAAIVLAATMTACGGGGGGGGGGLAGLASGGANAPAAAAGGDAASAAIPGESGAPTSGGSGGATPAASLSFSPSVVKQNISPGASGTLSVIATVADPSVFGSTVYVYVVDSQKVLTNQVSLVPMNTADRKSFYAVLYTSPTLPVGRYQGNLEVHLCKDINCAVEYPGSPAALPYDLTIAPKPLVAAPIDSTAATVHRGAPLSKAVTVWVSGPDLAWTATSDASWLKVTNGKGTGGGTFTVSYDVSALDVGNYTGTVTVRSGDDQTSKVSFTLQVLPTQFSMTSGIPNFNAVNGTTIAAQNVSFELDNKVASPWTATSLAAWLDATPLSGVTPATIALKPDPSRGPLASGSYSGDLLLSSPGVPNKTVTAKLTLVKPSLSAPSTSVVLGGPTGRDLSSPASVTVSLNTGSNPWPWSLSALPSWLSANSATGTVGGSGTAVGFTPQAAGVSPGSVSAPVTVSAVVNGDTVTLPLVATLNVDQRRLLPSEWGVGFADTPTGSVLTRSLKVSDNFGGSLTWTATSDSPWLTVTPSGTTGGASTLTLTANTAALTPSSLSYATVTVSTSTPGVDAAVIRVGLWKDATGLPAMTKLTQNYQEVTADKIRPYIYAHSGGTSIDIYHAYTATKIGTLAAVGSALGRMSVSPDGSRLYALDTASGTLKVVDLTTTAVSSWKLDRGVGARTSVLAIRPNGVEVVLVGDGTAYAAGRSLGSAIAGTLTASSDGRKVFAQDTGYSPASVGAFDVDYSEMSGGVLMVKRTAGAGFINNSSNGQDIAVSGDGTRLYTASGAPYRCLWVDPTNLSFVGSLPGGDAYPTNVEVTSDGRVICGISGLSSSSADFWVHSAAGALLGSFKLGGGGPKTGQLVVTPDGLVMAALSGAPALVFVPIGP